MRRTLANVFEHVRFNGSAWTPGATLTAPADGLADAGVFLAGTTTAVNVYALAADHLTIRSATFDGGAWSAWSPFVTCGNVCGSLSGYATTTDRALVWTEQGKSGNEIHGRVLP